MTVPAIIENLRRLNRSKLKLTEASGERVRKPKPLRMGLQVPCGLDAQVSEKGFVWPITGTDGGQLPRAGPPKREQGGGRTPHARPFHMLISIPPKYAVASVVGFIKGKSAIHIARSFMGRRKNFVGQNFWARGYFVSTVGLDEAHVREYIKKQEQADRLLDQLQLVDE